MIPNPWKFFDFIFVFFFNRKSSNHLVSNPTPSSKNILSDNLKYTWEKVYFRSQILERSSIGKYWNISGVPVLPGNVIFTFFRTCWWHPEANNTGTPKWSGIVQYSCTSIWDLKFTFSYTCIFTNKFILRTSPCFKYRTGSLPVARPSASLQDDPTAKFSAKIRWYQKFPIRSSVLLLQEGVVLDFLT